VHLAKEARNFLKGRDPGENNQEYQHCAVMQVALGAAFCEHATTANADSSPVGRQHLRKPRLNSNEVEEEEEDPEDPQSLPDHIGQGMPARATPRASSQLRDDTEVWQRWWMRCQQLISEKIDENVGMNPLASAPREHLCHIKIPMTTVLYVMVPSRFHFLF
jgi:hypothetical protein